MVLRIRSSITLRPGQGTLAKLYATRVLESSVPMMENKQIVTVFLKYRRKGIAFTAIS
jgi:hypothetical protein